MTETIVYVVAQAGEEQAMAYLGPCGRDGVLDAMLDWDQRHNWSYPTFGYEWTDDDCLDVHELRVHVTEHDPINRTLADLGAVQVGRIVPIEGETSDDDMW